jgi:hypothetical protein
MFEHFGAVMAALIAFWCLVTAGIVSLLWWWLG